MGLHIQTCNSSIFKTQTRGRGGGVTKETTFVVSNHISLLGTSRVEPELRSTYGRYPHPGHHVRPFTNCGQALPPLQFIYESNVHAKFIKLTETHVLPLRAFPNSFPHCLILSIKRHDLSI